MKFTTRKNIAVRPATHKRICRRAAKTGQRKEVVADTAVNKGLEQMENEKGQR